MKDIEKQSSEVPPAANLREMVFLAEQAKVGEMKILPGPKWSWHYPADKMVRQEKLQGLKEGRYLPKDVGPVLRPDALIYDVGEIDKLGLENIAGRIKDLTAYQDNYDYDGYTEFISRLKDADIEIEQATKFYDDISHNRVQKKLLDSYGYTGRKQILGSLKQQSAKIIQEMPNQDRLAKVLALCKLNWLKDSYEVVDDFQVNQALTQLSGDERKLFSRFKKQYESYIQTGDPVSYDQMLEGLITQIDKINRPVQSGDSSQEMQELEKELEKYSDQVSPPGTAEDPGIPPNDSDEYLSSPEKMKDQILYSIEPAGQNKIPLTGYYRCGQKSYYDVDAKTWSKKKRITEYIENLNGQDRQTISGQLDSGLKSLPLPNGYAVDFASLQYSGSKPNIFRDQNGCFYVQSDSSSKFSVDFLPEQNKFVSQPIPEDLDSLYWGKLSDQTELAIQNLSGDNITKARQARQYVLANHFYPGGGDLDMAQALQLKLREESDATNYLQNIDLSTYLECYSANSLFIAMLRRAGVPARLVVGHKIDACENNKAVINSKTGHAWTEIWNGSFWCRIDATPAPKPEDSSAKNEDKHKDQSDKKAADGGIEDFGSLANENSSKSDHKSADDTVPTGDSDGPNQPGESVDANNDQIGKSGMGGDPAGMPEVGDSDFDILQQQLQQAEEDLKRMDQEQKIISKKISDLESFEDLQDVTKQIKDSDLLEEMKELLEKKLEAKEEIMKDDMVQQLDRMVEDGFLDKKRAEDIKNDLEKSDLNKLSKIQNEIDNEKKLYDKYEEIKDEVQINVDEWSDYFADLLPKIEEVDYDEDSQSRSGKTNPRAIQRPRNLLFGTIKNPRIISASIEPRFVASIVLDVSGSMAGEKLNNARKLLVFYSELFSKISKEYGYIRFAIYTFSDTIKTIKTYQQDYDSVEKYDFHDNTSSTIKYRLMTEVKVSGGTNMLPAIQRAASELNQEVFDYPDFASAMYFIGDGGDSYNNAKNIREFLKLSDSEQGFGRHVYSAVLLGKQSEKRALSDIFGEENTTVAEDFESLVEESMLKFADDIESHIESLE